MRARIGLGAATLLLLATACGDNPVTSLRIVPSSDLKVGETTQLEVFAIHEDGSEKPIKEKLSFESSDEAVATVDETGLVTVHRRGPLVLTAKADVGDDGVVEGTLEKTPRCEYPAHNGKLGNGEVIPPFRWRAKLPSGRDIDFRLEDVYCNVEWKDVKTIHFIVSAGWCPYCNEYARELSSKDGLLRSLGMQVVTIEIETSMPGGPADTEFAYRHLKSLREPVAGIVAGDLNTVLPGAPLNGRNFITRSGFAAALPTRTIIRTSDMKMIADASVTGPWSGYGFPLEAIAKNPELDWSTPEAAAKNLNGQ